ncbi:MAG: efflux RND transporter periplasmic adaptor subunit [Bradyrhizobium sp.]
MHQTEIRIAPETSGRLNVFRVAAGQQVHKGDVLAQLSSPELAASVEEARANADTARADRANIDVGVRKEEVDISGQGVTIAEANLVLAKNNTLELRRSLPRTSQASKCLTKGSLHSTKPRPVLAWHRQPTRRTRRDRRKRSVILAEAKVVLAESTIADLEASLAKTTLIAPVDGVVKLLVAEPGEAISPGQPVLTLGIESERWFTFTVREDLLAGIAIGVPLNLVNTRGDRVETRVTELRPLGEFAVWRAKRAVGDHDVNSFLVRADPTTATRGFEPGMTVWIDRR